MKAWHWITLTVALLVAIALLTVLNKRWWAKRIVARWNIENDLPNNEAMLHNTSLARMVDIYRIGMEGWELRTNPGEGRSEQA